MPDRFLLVTGDFDVSGLIGLMNRLNPACDVELLRTQAELLRAVPEPVDNVRLLCFCTDVIVPRPVLENLGVPAYNIHPGSPAFPGHYPECWGVYHGATKFGATLHVMEPRVDEGAIIDTKLFQVPKGTGQREMAEGAARAAIELLMRWIEPLVCSDATLPPNGQRWEGKKWRTADREALSTLTPDIEAEELERRRRAFAELPPGQLKMKLGGLVFVYLPGAAAAGF